MERPAHRRIVRREALDVGKDRPRRARGDAAQDPEVRIALERGHVGVRKVLGDVRLAGLEHGRARGRLGHEAPRDLFEIGGAAMRGGRGRPGVVRIPHERHVALRHPLLDHERAGADGATREVLPHRLHRRRRDGRERRERDHSQERRVRLLEPDPDGLGVDDVRSVVGPEEGAGDAGCAERLLDPIERRLDRGGVEHRAVVELHALPQLERVALAITRDVPGLGEARPDLAVLGIDHRQRVRELDQDLARRRAIRDVRVERVDVLPGGEDDLATRLRLPVRRQRRNQEQHNRRDRSHDRLLALTRRAGESRTRWPGPP